MGSQNSKLQMDAINLKSDNPFLHSNLGNGPHLSGGSSVLKPSFHTNTNYPNFSASTQDNASKRNSSYAEGSMNSSCFVYFSKILLISKTKIKKMS